MAELQTKRESLAWSVHPARERPAATVFAVAIVAAMIWMVGEIMQNSWWGALPAVFFLVTLQRFFFPSRFTIDDEGVAANFAFSAMKFRWAEIRRFHHDQQGAFLSTRRRTSWFDGFRGMQLVFVDNRDAVVEQIDSQLSTFNSQSAKHS